MQVLFRKRIKLMHKIVRITGIIRSAIIIRGRVLLEEIRYVNIKFMIPMYPSQS